MLYLIGIEIKKFQVAAWRCLVWAIPVGPLLPVAVIAVQEAA
jgi:hypothetical protein